MENEHYFLAGRVGNPEIISNNTKCWNKMLKLHMKLMVKLYLCLQNFFELFSGNHGKTFLVLLLSSYLLSSRGSVRENLDRGREYSP